MKEDLNVLKRKAEAFDEWLEKTEWVQSQHSSFPFNTLGLHRADVMRKEIERLRGLVLSLGGYRD